MVRRRTVVCGALLIPAVNYWVVRMEHVVAGPYPTTASLFTHCVFVLVVLALGNSLLRRYRPRLALTQAELLLVYAMICIGSAFAGLDLLAILVQMMPHPYWFAASNPSWLPRFGDHLPRALMVSDVPALVHYYNGNDTLYRWEHLRAWLPPLGWWSLFFLMLMGTLMCLNVLVRQQWSDRERLTFPLTILPLEITRPGPGGVSALFRSRLFWIGVGLAGGIDVVNGLNFLYPSVPAIPVKHVDLAPLLFRERPWSAMGWTPYSFYPFAIGLGYLLPLDLLFSCWLFYLYWKAQVVVAASLGWDQLTQDFPFVKEQAFGGYMAVFVFALWLSRRSWRGIWRRVLGQRSELDDAREAISYRAALIGAVAGFVGVTGFFVWMGLPWWLSALSFAMYFALSLAIARIRAELGPPVHDMHFCGADSILTRALGTTAFAPRELTAINFFWFFNRAYRSHPMPYALEGLRMADRIGASQRIFFWAMALAVVIGMVATFWAFLDHAYVYGTAGEFRSGYQKAQQAFSRLASWFAARQPANVPANWALLIGFLCTGALFLLRTQFLWFPLHPIGYAISGSWSMNLVWLPLMIAWAAKLAILRYGGLRLYRHFLPFFLGLIVGESVVGCTWSLVGIVGDFPTYSFWGA